MGDYRRIDVGGHCLAARAFGSGSPAVVFENDIGTVQDYWNPVVRAVAERTLAVTYDRAGNGRSDRGPGPRTADRLSEDLGTLLRRLGLEGPCVLVGHSFGAVLVRLFAAWHPADTAGIVLVDPYEEHFEIGLEDRLRDWEMRVIQDWRRQVLEMSCEGARQEIQSTAVNLMLLRSSPRHLHVPAIILSANRFELCPRDRLSDSSEEILYPLWIEAHKRVAASFTDCRHIVVEDTGHYLHHDDPGAVSSAIIELVEKARSKR